MKIPVAKPYLTSAEAQAASKTILSNWVTQGPRVQEFEDKFAKYVGAKYATAVSNCTSALHLALIVSGIKNGDEVICPSLSFIATANSIVHAGGTPVFAEVNDDYNLDIEDVKKRITSKTRAIILVHQIGMPADINAFSKLCKTRKLTLIEDAACAAGSKYLGQRIGSHSNLVCFSFHPRKVITTGDGGMITTSNKKYDKRLKQLRQHAMSVNDRARHLAKTIITEKYLEVGYNYRMTDIQAAIGIKQLEKLERLVSERRKIAMRYNQAFKNINCILLPMEKSFQHSNYQSYCISLKENSPITRDVLMRKLLSQGISSRRGVMTAHSEPAYKAFNSKLPRSEKLANNSLILPLYVPMKKKEIEYVVENFLQFLQG